MPEAVIVAAARTPIGRAFKGSMIELRPDDLTATIIQAAMDQVPQLAPSDVVDVHLGCGLPGGEQGFNMARVVTTLLGWEVPGTTVTRYCSSSLQTTRMAFHAIKAGEGDVFVSAGVELVSRFVKGNSDSLPDTHNPRFADAEARTEQRAQQGATGWEAPEGLSDIYIPMGQTAENVASIRGISREEQDDFAYESQMRYAKADAEGFWEREITPIDLPNGETMTRDDSPRPSTERDKLAELQPVFRPDGTVTAGNACPLNDGAAAVVVMSDTKAAELGIEPLARIVSTGVSALDPEIMGLGPVGAIRQALDHAGMSIGDIDIVEINEAFAAQVIPSARELGIDIDRLNPHGGSIACGHPFGMTGARITNTLLNGLRHRDATFGIESMCVGGGQGMAMVVERLS
ncbi:acetyl-CoA C-acetyltransferase [Egicoccus halophilus]|uniref:Acetyl-CoA acetyltransferase n=1 Tax=Egicoccus halophilus TaxID=1670830 RepID=A0A8J3ACT2_9ACTN|nr:acetyl-CoA C-acetyltransferase [Egicoccus halophilus]GGI09019.1 acetyl-CoA acetyltransferase [Egicoccus halophilus]